MDLSSDRILNDDLKDRRGYSHLKEEALDRTMWRNRFGGGFGPVVRQNAERMMNQQSEYKVFYELMCWLSGSLTCRLPNVMRSPPARRSRKFNQY